MNRFNYYSIFMSLIFFSLSSCDNLDLAQAHFQTSKIRTIIENNLESQKSRVRRKTATPSELYELLELAPDKLDIVLARISRNRILGISRDVMLPSIQYSAKILQEEIKAAKAPKDENQKRKREKAETYLINLQKISEKIQKAKNKSAKKIRVSKATFFNHRLKP